MAVDKGSFSIKKRYLYKFLRTLRPVTDEVRVEFKDDMVGLVAVDPAHVCMLDVKLGYEYMEDYEGLEDITLGLSVPKLRMFMSNFKYDDVLDVSIYRDRVRDYKGGSIKKDFMKVSCEGFSRTIPMLDTMGMADPNIPSLDFPVQLELNNEIFRTMVDLSDQMADHIQVIVDDDKMKMVAEDDHDDLTFDSDDRDFDPNITWEHNPGREEAMFAIDYFEDIINVLPKKADLKAKFKSEYPMRLKFQQEDKAIQGYYLLAPRLESE